jgi:hypothetical protein
MFTKARQLISGVIGGASADRSEAAQKAARTRKLQADRRSDAAKRAAATRKANAEGRSKAAQRGAETRRQRDARVEAMVEATRRD